MILAIDTLKIAIRKKNIANTPVARNDRFFTSMRENGGNGEISTGFAIAPFIRKPVGVAIPRANPAILQFLNRLNQLFKIEPADMIPDFLHLVSLSALCVRIVNLITAKINLETSS